MQNALAVGLAREGIKLLNGPQVLLQPGRLEFGIVAAQVVTAKGSIGLHAAAQQTAAQGTVGERRDAVVATIGQNTLLRLAFKEIVWRLGRVQRRDRAKRTHLLDREITDSNRADFSSPMKFGHRLGHLLDRRIRIRPVHLIDVDNVSTQPAQRILDLLVDPRPAAVAERLALAPIKTDLGGDQDFVPPNFLKRPADDFFRMTETVDRRRIDEVDPTIDGAPNRAD